MITTNIDKWLIDIALEDYNEIDDLYTCVTSEINMSSFKISINENTPRRIFVTPIMQGLDTLMLTDKSKPVFINKLEQKYCGGIDVETYCSLERDKEKDDI